MSTWNYRVILEGHAYYIAEVHYNSLGAICGMTSEGLHIPTVTEAEGVGELKGSIELMLLAFDKPILLSSDIQFAPWDS